MKDIKIEEINNGFLAEFKNEDGKPEKQYFKDAQSIVSFFTEDFIDELSKCRNFEGYEHFHIKFEY